MTCPWRIGPSSCCDASPEVEGIRATYRVQLHAGFTFDDAAATVPYLARLGVSHLYCSPYLQAAKGSTHGYDVVDHSRLNEELGGEAAFGRLVEALSAHGMSQVLDIVPNHMAIPGRDNAWWWDVLENGPASRYASFFDIDWDPPERKLVAQVLVPVLGDQYGRVLEDGQLELRREGGSFLVAYHEHEVPISPRSVDDLLSAAAERCESDEVASLATAFGRLPHALITDRASVDERHRDKEILKNRLADLCASSVDLASAVDEEVKAVNDDPDALHNLLERQNYRLAYWRTAGQELDYRRFFDITTLVGLRTEDEPVFRETHALVTALVADGAVEGLRIDHVDGLRDPYEYLERLHSATSGTYLVVEKILEGDETLPERWPIAGTSGYDYLNEVNGLFVDPQREAAMTEVYARFTGEPTDYADICWNAKQQIMRTVLAADIHRLTALAADVVERHRRYRDHTRAELRDALRELIAAFGVYRTYVRPGEEASAEDVAQVDAAVTTALARRPDLDADLMRFLADVALGRHDGPAESELCLRMQQVTSPVMAKGVEDTVFYRFNRLVSLNEVGGEPDHFGISVEEYHRRRASASWRGSLRATSTHDTKRSEDVRTRLNLLSEMPDRWGAAVERWGAMHERHLVDGAPDLNFRYLLYQTLVGAWPLPVDRAVAYAEKATKEAKVHTSWVDPSPAYDAAVRSFVEAVLADEDFTTEVGAFVSELVEPGRASSLAQTVLKLTAPGVADIYQGTELWDLSLVDPDNRRPVDYRLRSELLDELDRGGLDAALARADDGATKLWAVQRLLGLRLDPLLPYTALPAQGPKARHVVAYLRGSNHVVVVSRLHIGLAGDWQDTALTLPEGQWVDVLSDASHAGGGVGLRTLLDRLPVAVLRKA